jgi:hypothetical protein
MKYLTYSGLNKIVHLYRDLRDVKRYLWTAFCEFHIGQLSGWFHPISSYPLPSQSYATLLTHGSQDFPASYLLSSQSLGVEIGDQKILLTGYTVNEWRSPPVGLLPESRAIPISYQRMNTPQPGS